MDHREEQIVVETAGYRLTGKVRLPVGGYGSRLTDHLNANEREFIALTDVEIQPLDGAAATHRRFVALARRHVIFASSLDESAVEPPA